MYISYIIVYQFCFVLFFCISLYFVDNILFEGTWKLATHTFQQTQLLFILCYHCLMCK